AILVPVGGVEFDVHAKVVCCVLGHCVGTQWAVPAHHYGKLAAVLVQRRLDHGEVLPGARPGNQDSLHYALTRLLFSSSCFTIRLSRCPTSKAFSLRSTTIATWCVCPGRSSRPLPWTLLLPSAPTPSHITLYAAYCSPSVPVPIAVMTPTITS